MRKILIGAGFVLAVLFLFFFRLGDRPLWSSDEGRFGEIAREMAESGDYVVPSFNYVDYLDKPAMASWLSAGAIHLWGPNSFSVRFPLAVAAVLGIFMTGWFVRRFCSDRAAFLAMMFQTTGLGYVLVGRFAVIDMLLTFFLSGAFFCLFAGYQFQKKQWYWAAYLFIGAAFLTKGLLAVVLTGGTMLSFLLWERKLGELKKMSLFFGAGLFLLVVAPWFLAMNHREPEFFNIFFVKHQFSRFAGGDLGRSRPFWFYAPILLAIALPWSFYIPAAVKTVFKAVSFEKFRRFLFCWAAVAFLFFSMSKGKLPYYILPISVPLSILFALLFDDFFNKRLQPNTESLLHKSWIVLYGLLFVAIPGFNLFILIWGDTLIEASRMMRPFLWTASGGTLVLLFLSAKAYGKKDFKKALWILAAVPYLILTTTSAAMNYLTPMQSTAEFALEIQRLDKPGSIVAIYSSPDHFSDLPFNLKKRISVVGTDRGTLDRESREDEALHGPSEWFLAKDTFADLFNARQRQVFLLVDEDKYAEIVGTGLKSPKILKQEFNKVLVTNL